MTEERKGREFCQDDQHSTFSISRSDGGSDAFEIMIHLPHSNKKLMIF